MPDTVYDKLDRIEQKVDGVKSSITIPLNNTNNRATTCVSVDFIKNAERVFCYQGDNSRLKRQNAKSKKYYWGLAILFTSLFAILSVSSFFLNVPFAIVVSILCAFVSAPYIYDALTWKPLKMKIPHDEWTKNKKFIFEFDDNNIVEQTLMKSSVKIRYAVSIIYLYILTLVIAAMSLSSNVVIAIFSFLILIIDTLAFRIFKMPLFSYSLIFEYNGTKISYHNLKLFMTENNLK